MALTPFVGKFGECLEQQCSMIAWYGDTIYTKWLKVSMEDVVSNSAFVVAQSSTCRSIDLSNSFMTQKWYHNDGLTDSLYVDITSSLKPLKHWVYKSSHLYCIEHPYFHLMWDFFHTWLINTCDWIYLSLSLSKHRTYNFSSIQKVPHCNSSILWWKYCGREYCMVTIN